MYTMLVRGQRQAILAVHRLDNPADVRDLLLVYEALGHKTEAIEVQHEEQQEQAA